MTKITLPITLSLAVPAYNESAGIEQVISNWHAYLKNQPQVEKFEIVICNDGSTDNTGKILDGLAQQTTSICPIHFQHNQGAAAALTAAIAKTQYDWVLLLDADDQFPIKNFSQMLKALRDADADAAIGIREKQAHWFAVMGSRVSGIICNIVHGTRIKDFNSAFKLANGMLLRSLTLEAKGMNYSTEVTSRLLERKAKLVEVDIEHQPRNMGKSSLRFVRDSLHRLLFVGYISIRQLLLRLGILRRPS